MQPASSKSRHPVKIQNSHADSFQFSAYGDIQAVKSLLESNRTTVNFRDYDRRTALHVAASEGHLEMCRFLLKNGARVNRSDRWGGSPLDDAHRHHHREIIQLLRQEGATTGSGNRINNLITAAADGDVDEIQMLLHLNPDGSLGVDVSKGDYDKRTPLHLAAGEGHSECVRVLCEAGADVNAEDRWMRRPLDDAFSGNHTQCIRILEEHGAKKSMRRIVSSADVLNRSQQRLDDNLKIDFNDIDMIDRIGAGAFGEIYKCRWRGTLVAAKIIKSATITRDWAKMRTLKNLKVGGDVDEAIHDLDTMDDDEMNSTEKREAIADFRREITLLKTLRHPNIVLLLAYSTTQNYECLVSELMKCSLLDVFKSHIVQGTKMKHRTQIAYAIHLSLGMNYLHKCNPPIIHRDLKPANLLIDHSGVLKISDFGLSKVRPDPTSTERDVYVMTGETGSYRFMAPECFRHESYNETVDVYSFAMIFFYLTVGRPPWPTLSGLDAVKKAAEEGDRPNVPREIDYRLQALMKNCWEEQPGKRSSFLSISETLAEYNRVVLKGAEDTVVSASPPDTGKSRCQCTIQ